MRRTDITAPSTLKSLLCFSLVLILGTAQGFNRTANHPTAWVFISDSLYGLAALLIQSATSLFTLAGILNLALRTAGNIDQYACCLLPANRFAT